MNHKFYLGNRLKAFSIFAAFMLLSATVKAATSYAIWCEGSGTMYFLTSSSTIKQSGTIDGQRITRLWSGDDVDQTGNYPKWNEEVRSSLKRVVITPSFKEAQPKSTCKWFYRCANLEKIEGLQYLNTSQVTNMDEMFRESTALTSLDLTSFDTGNVRTMDSMFYGCSGLTALDVSYFNTSNVTTMAAMFGKCENLESIEFYNIKGYSFNTYNVTNMTSMFFECKSLKKLNLQLFDTGNVTGMNYMFYGCSSLTSLNLQNFNTKKVNDMIYMFTNCSNLQKIVCNNTWTAQNSESMFQGCTCLKGAIAYDPQKIDVKYANPTTGYFYSHITYPLYVNGEQVDNGNCDDLSVISGVSGNMTYDPQTKTLTLGRGLTINATSTYAIQSSVEGLTILANGANVVYGETNGMQLLGATVIKPGSQSDDYLQVNGKNGAGIHVGNTTLTVQDGVRLYAYGTTNGISGFFSGQGHTYFGELVVSGKNTMVYANGLSNASITLMKSITMNDGLNIMLPNNASFVMDGGTGSVCYPNGEIVKNQNVVIQYDPSTVQEYDLYICGKRVNSENCSALMNYIEGFAPLEGSPHVARYDAEKNVLMLSNVSITSQTESAIDTNIDGLTILISGNVVLTTYAMSMPALNVRKPAELQAARNNAKMWLNSENTAMIIYSDFTINNCALAANGQNYGIAGRSSGSLVRPTYQGNLTVKGLKSVVTAFGSKACVAILNSLTLEDGLRITHPENAVFTDHNVMQGSAIVKGTNVIIEYDPNDKIKGDVNRDGVVNISDVVAVINTMAGDTTFIATADVNGDKDINISDVVTIINIMASNK